MYKEGNEDLIEFYNNSIQDGTYRNYKDFSKAAAFRSQQEQRNRGKRDVKEQRGENAGTISVDLRHLSERGGDNAQGNSDEQGEINDIRFRYVGGNSGYVGYSMSKRAADVGRASAATYYTPS